MASARTNRGPARRNSASRGVPDYQPPPGVGHPRRAKPGLSRTSLLLGLVFVGICCRPVVRAIQTMPPVWDVVADDFESGTLDAWSQSSLGSLGLVPGDGRNGSTGLSVTVGQPSGYLYQTGVARAEEGYVTFWLNPNNVVIPDEGTSWVPGKSICVTAIVNSEDWWPPLVALYVRQLPSQGYQAYLAWPMDEEDNRHYDYESGAFDLIDGWQEIAVGYRVNEWVAAWRNGELMRQSTDVVHTDPYGDIIQFGKTSSTSNTPSGALLFDDFAFQVPRVDDLWVDGENGNDEDDGLTASSAFQTIQRAADLAGPGTTVHILPGVYRESVHPAMSGSGSEAALYIAEDGPGTAIVRGSEPSASVAWVQLTADTIGLPSGVDPTNVYYADLSAWALDGPPRFVVELDSSGNVAARLPLAREPDWEVATEWKHHEFWWAADGGSMVAGCDPATDPDPNCDTQWRSMTQLTDRTDDDEPAGMEPGNLSRLGDLTGATLVAIDTFQGHYVYRRTITAHDVPAGRVTVDRICEHDSGSGNPGLGWGSKYYVENHPGLLDTPGEWWYDVDSGRLYLWPPTAGNPATMDIEISRRDNGFSFRNRSYITLDGLTVEFVNDSAIYQGNWSTHKSIDNTVRNAVLRYANWGVFVEQSVRADAPSGNVIDGFTLEGSEIAHMDTLAIRLIDWWENGADPDLFTHSGVLNTLIRHNEMHHLGFRTDGDNAIGASFSFANRLRFEGNHVHHVAHNGVQFSRSVIQSSKTYGFTPDEIKTGGILVKDNVFEKACQLTTDCGAIKFWGSAPDNHVFRDVLVTGNTFRDTFGWTYVSEKRRRWMGGTASEVRGTGGFGLYVDHASGIHAYRNIAYNTAYVGYIVYGRWRDGDIVYYNNVAANSLYGFSLGGSQYDTHGCVNTQVVDNIIINNEGYGIVQSDADGVYDNMMFDHNLYFNNGWRAYEDGGLWKPGAMVIWVSSGSDGVYQTLADVQAGTAWEAHGVEGDPGFWDYDLTDHDIHDGSWPDFHLTPASASAIDRGTAALPPSLTALLETFEVDDPHWGAAYDIGRYEGGFDVLTAPSIQSVNPGGVARYALRLSPLDLPHTVTLTVTSPSPGLIVAVDPMQIGTSRVATITVTDTHPGQSLLPGLWHAMPITATGGGFTRTTGVGLLVGGARLYLPAVMRDIGMNSPRS
jgi:hypothetical protein